MTKKEKLIEVFENLSASEKICVHNEYCASVNAFDDEIHEVEQMDELFYGQTAEWILHRAYYGEYNPTADYFKFNGYGNIQSIWEFELDSYIDWDAVADYCLDNNDDLYNSEVREILDTDDEQEDDE